MALSTNYFDYPNSHQLEYLMREMEYYMEKRMHKMNLQQAQMQMMNLQQAQMQMNPIYYANPIPETAPLLKKDSKSEKLKNLIAHYYHLRK